MERLVLHSNELSGTLLKKAIFSQSVELLSFFEVDEIIPALSSFLEEKDIPCEVVSVCGLIPSFDSRRQKDLYLAVIQATLKDARRLQYFTTAARDLLSLFTALLDFGQATYDLVSRLPSADLGYILNQCPRQTTEKLITICPVAILVKAAIASQSSKVIEACIRCHAGDKPWWDAFGKLSEEIIEIFLGLEPRPFLTAFSDPRFHDKFVEPLARQILFCLSDTKFCDELSKQMVNFPTKKLNALRSFISPPLAFVKLNLWVNPYLFPLFNQLCGTLSSALPSYTSSDEEREYKKCLQSNLVPPPKRLKLS